MKKAGKRIGIIILVILLIVAAYLVYVMVSYHRLPDKLTLEVNRAGNQAAFEEDRQVEVGKYGRGQELLGEGRGERDCRHLWNGRYRKYS